ncbi:MAG: LLM class flavin-dependent oxidoreductase [Streptosporangiales bacterium]
MKFGLLLAAPNQAAGTDLADAAVRNARRARELGFDIIVAGQHILTGPEPYLQPLPLLSRLVPETGSMRLATGVLLLPLHEPVHIAEQTASLDVLSGGRLILGVGQGYRPVEFESLGVPRQERGARHREALEVIERLWSGEPVTYNGRHFALDGVRASITPVQRPRPPIWCAATTRARFDKVLQAGYMPYTGPTTPASAALSWASASSQGIVLRRDIFVTKKEPRTTAYEHATQRLRRYARWGYGDDAAPDPDVLTDRYLLGSVSDCVEQLSTYARGGVDTVVLRCQWPALPTAESEDMLERVGEVLNDFRGKTVSSRDG